ncbi:MAG: cupin domain-containing protein [Pseudomonadota bacterium]
MENATDGRYDGARVIAERLVRYAELQPCTTAFIDTRTPGSAQKENFTIVGPGVAENPDQHVHISIPHGFNIGAARQPPACVNSQHSHETAEVFMVHSGQWAFYLGDDRSDGEVALGPGDTISIPIHVFRGFANVGEDTGMMFAVLGGDDPGRVTWAPYVFDAAREHGLLLMEDGSLVDTARGEQVPAGKRPMPPTTPDDVAKLRRMTSAELAECVVSEAELAGTEAPDGGVAGLSERPIIGAASTAEKLPAGKMAWSHGFHLRRAHVAPGASTPVHRRNEEEVVIVHRGALNATLDGHEVTLEPGDTLTVPIGMARGYGNRGDEPAVAFIVRGGDTPQSAQAVTADH